MALPVEESLGQALKSRFLYEFIRNSASDVPQRNPRSWKTEEKDDESEASEAAWTRNGSTAVGRLKMRGASSSTWRRPCVANPAA